MIKLTLVRVWKDYQSEPENIWVDWDAGRFSLPMNLVSSALRDAATGARPECRLTVYSTDELEWVVDRFDHRHDTPDLFHFTCIPRLKHLRNCIIPDVPLIELWLEAEKRWRSSPERGGQSEELARDLFNTANLALGPYGVVRDAYVKTARQLIESGWRKGDPARPSLNDIMSKGASS